MKQKIDFEDLRNMIQTAIKTDPMYIEDDWQEEFVNRAKRICQANGWSYEDYIKERKERYGN